MTKQVKISKELVEAVKTLLLAEAHEKMIRPIVEGYQRQILMERGWKVAKEYRVFEGYRFVTEPSQTYLLSSKDLTKFIDLCHVEIVRRGLKVKEKGHCPLSTADYMVTLAQNALLDAAEYITGIKRDEIYMEEHRRHMIALTMNFVLSYHTEITGESLMKEVTS